MPVTWCVKSPERKVSGIFTISVLCRLPRTILVKRATFNNKRRAYNAQDKLPPSHSPEFQTIFGSLRLYYTHTRDNCHYQETLSLLEERKSFLARLQCRAAVAECTRQCKTEALRRRHLRKTADTREKRRVLRTEQCICAPSQSFNSYLSLSRNPYAKCSWISSRFRIATTTISASFSPFLISYVISWAALTWLLLSLAYINVAILLTYSVIIATQFSAVAVVVTYQYTPGKNSELTFSEHNSRILRNGDRAASDCRRLLFRCRTENLNFRGTFLLCHRYPQLTKYARVADSLINSGCGNYYIRDSYFGIRSPVLLYTSAAIWLIVERY